MSKDTSTHGLEDAEFELLTLPLVDYLNNLLIYSRLTEIYQYTHLTLRMKTYFLTFFLFHPLSLPASLNTLIPRDVTQE